MKAHITCAVGLFPPFFVLVDQMEIHVTIIIKASLYPILYIISYDIGWKNFKKN